MGCATEPCGSVRRVRKTFRLKFCGGSVAVRCVWQLCFVSNNADNGHEDLGVDDMIPATHSTAALAHRQSLRSATRTSGFCASAWQTKRNSQLSWGPASFLGITFEGFRFLC